MGEQARWRDILSSLLVLSTAQGSLPIPFGKWDAYNGENPNLEMGLSSNGAVKTEFSKSGLYIPNINACYAGSISQYQCQKSAHFYDF